MARRAIPVNQLLQELAIRHQVNLQRTSSGALRRLLPILARSDAELVSELIKRAGTLETSFTSARLQRLLEAIREINRDAYTQLQARAKSELRDIAKAEGDYQVNALRRSIPVQVDVVSPNRALLGTVVNDTLIEGKLLGEWFSQLSASRATRVRDQIRLGMVQGETSDQIVRRIRGTKSAGFNDGVLAIERRNAAAIIQTAVSNVAAASRDMIYRENDDLVKEVQWVATLDTRTCEECMALDGKTFAIGEGRRPPAHVNCRCTTVPVVMSWRELGIDLDEAPEGTRASMDGQVPSTITYNDWLKSQSAEVQDEALGKTRGRLFRAGGLSVDRFTDSRGNHLTIDQLRERDARAFKQAGL